jgi:regulatory protein
VQYQEEKHSKILSRAMAYCSRCERCPADLYAKLPSWGALPDDAPIIISKLIEEKFIDIQRYAIAYAQDKFRQNKWGRLKISHSLRQKSIPQDIIELAVHKFEDIYEQHICTELEKKLSSISNFNGYEAKAKLARFSASRGYEPDLFFKIIDKLITDK